MLFRSGTQIGEILEACHAARVVTRRIPRLAELIENKVLVDQIREVHLEDLLGRPEVMHQEKGIRTQIEGAGTNVILVFSGSSNSGGMRGGMGSQPTITWDDVRAMQTELPAVRAVAPLTRTMTQAISETQTWTTTVYGTTPDYFVIRNWDLAVGAGLSSSDVAGGTKNVVIGRTVADKLFGVGVDPLGQVIRIRNAPYSVIGVLAKKGQGGMGDDQDDAI